MWSRASIPGATIETFFDLAEPLEDPDAIFSLARELQEAAYLMASTDATESDGSKSTNALETITAAMNSLRGRRQTVLVSYLLNHTELGVEQGIKTADGLFEYFLVDVNTGPIPETSRIQQAISTIQLFVQRCLLGLERKRGVPEDAVQSIHDRWNVIGRYTVWEANRKVFLFPENWLEPSLRQRNHE